MKRAIAIAAVTAAVASPLAAGAAEVAVTDAWSRPAVGTGVVYATITNRTDHPVRLIGAASPLAAKVEVHESMAMTMGGPGSGSAMTMKPIASLAIPAHGSVVLKPGGYHLMLMGLRQDLAPGQHVHVTLRFASASAVRVTAEVRRM